MTNKKRVTKKQLIKTDIKSRSLKRAVTHSKKGKRPITHSENKKKSASKKTKAINAKNAINSRFNNSIPLGTVIQTRDEFLESGKNYSGKPGYDKKGFYRPMAVVETNKKNEIAAQKITHGKNSIKLTEDTKSQWVNGISPYIETKDNLGKPIKIGNKFQINKSKKLTKNEVNHIKMESIKNTSKRLGKSNRSKLRKLKNRK